MIYLNDEHIRRIGVSWPLLAERIERVLKLFGTPGVVQPVKPYLRFGGPNNRIIAMPAYVGGEIGISGIKWIASFPDNVERGLPRAHGTIVLNDPGTGRPVAVLNGGLLNELRTAAVSAVMLKAYFDARRRERCRVGLIGWGPIGRRQLEMMFALFGDRIDGAKLFDIRGISRESAMEIGGARTEPVSSWREAYRGSDIVLTCTASSERYIDEPPASGALLLNVSLRDYRLESVRGIRAVVVDSWHEVCRENTDIERMHLEAGLEEKDVLTLHDVFLSGALRSMDPSQPVFFNPMGMAAFDVAVAAHYWSEAEKSGIGIPLE
ncbi:2,3-diaminopropionate biosynthesis protein SbnB [Paenibacillaceae bacterium WGS1546]|uniref:2,3-diaminopropionate biosynthesis protein SbnB n=1 Tax=Cohnella sp. WGS1546 TaxID=3366810 RepID=UPI00372CF91A